MVVVLMGCFFFFFQAEDGIRDADVTGVQTCALPISADDDLAGVDALGAVLVGPDRLGRRVRRRQVRQRRQAVVRRYAQPRLRDRNRRPGRGVGRAVLLADAALGAGGTRHAAAVRGRAAEVVPGDDGRHPRILLRDVGDTGRAVGVPGEADLIAIEQLPEGVVGRAETAAHQAVLLRGVARATGAARD